MQTACEFGATYWMRHMAGPAHHLQMLNMLHVQKCITTLIVSAHIGQYRGHGCPLHPVSHL